MTNVELPADMHCRSCEQRVHRAVRALDGVRSVTTDLKRQRVAVEFDDERLDESEVRAAVTGAVTHGVIGG
jgi:copper chaperone CopZ